MLDAWRGLGNRKGNAQLVLVGKGPMGDDLKRHPMAGVHLAGLRHGRALGEAYASADLFVQSGQDGRGGAMAGSSSSPTRERTRSS